MFSEICWNCFSYLTLLPSNFTFLCEICTKKYKAKQGITRCMKSKSQKERQPADGVGVGEEPNHTSAGKPGPPYIFHFFSVLSNGLNILCLLINPRVLLCLMQWRNVPVCAVLARFFWDFHPLDDVAFLVPRAMCPWLMCPNPYHRTQDSSFAAPFYDARWALWCNYNTIYEFCRLRRALTRQLPINLPSHI